VIRAFDRWRRRRLRQEAIRILVRDAMKKPGHEQVQHFGNGDNVTVIAMYETEDPTG
jgi:hypothetical protein